MPWAPSAPRPAVSRPPDTKSPRRESAPVSSFTSAVSSCIPIRSLRVRYGRTGCQPAVTGVPAISSTATGRRSILERSAASATSSAARASCKVQALGPPSRTVADECGQLVAIGRFEALYEISVERRTRLLGARLQRADGAVCVDAGHDAVLRPEGLQADVVAERIVPCPREDRKCPAAQTEHGDRHVDVVVVGEPGRLAHRAVGVDLGDLLARDEAQRVEVVDVEIAEDAARARDVRLRAAARDRAWRGARRAGARVRRSRACPARRGSPRRSAAGTRSGRGCPPARPPRSPRRAPPRPTPPASRRTPGARHCAASRSIGTCVGVGVAITRASMSAAASSSGVAATEMPSSPASARARAPSASHTVTEAIPGSDCSVRTWNDPMRPAPMTPTRRADDPAMCVPGSIGKRLQ